MKVARRGKLSVVLAAALCACGISSINAQTLTIDLEITGIAHQFMPPGGGGGGGGGGNGHVRDEILFNPAGLTGVDLDQYTSFKLRLFAPAGKKLVVNRTGSYSSSLNVFWQVEGMGDSSSNAVAATPSFEQFSGNVPTSQLYSFCAVGNAGYVLTIIDQEEYLDPIEFTAMSYSFTPVVTLPVTTPQDFTQKSSSSIPLLFSYSTEETVDPGAFVTLEDVTVEESFAITGISYSPGDEMLTLTWDSSAGGAYHVRASVGISSWDNTPVGADGITMTEDEIPGDGDRLTKTFDLGGLSNPPPEKLFFRVEKE